MKDQNYSTQPTLCIYILLFSSFFLVHIMDTGKFDATCATWPAVASFRPNTVSCKAMVFDSLSASVKMQPCTQGVLTTPILHYSVLRKCGHLSH